MTGRLTCLRAKGQERRFMNQCQEQGKDQCQGQGQEPGQGARTKATKARAKDHGQIKRSKVRSQCSGGLEHGAAEGVVSGASEEEVA